MKIKAILALAFAVVLTSSALAQAASTKAADVPKMKIAIVDVLAFREQVGELKAKYQKLQTEFAPRYREIESLQGSLESKQKVLAENKNLTPAQAQKLTEDLQEGKRTYDRLVEDSQAQAAKREREETEATYDKLSKFMDQYCTQRGITHVFDARRLQETGMVVYASSQANITDDFIKEYNKAYPSTAAATAKQ